MAESKYRSALLEGWLLLGALNAADGRLEWSKTAFERASGVAVETRRAQTSLARVHMALGETAEAIALLTALVGRSPQDVAARQMLAQALISSGRAKEAVQELEEALVITPDDPEVAFNLGAGNVRLGQLEEARRYFADVAKKRPIPQTHVLIGRTYSDFRLFQPAREALERALAIDPTVPRAHYYLGAIELRDRGRDGLGKAIDHFEQALKLESNSATYLYLGTALVAVRRFQDAIPKLEAATQEPATRIDALRFLGSAFLGLDRPKDAIAWLRKAEEAAEGSLARDRQRYSVHYQLGVALRRDGAEAEAAEHFATAARLSAELVEGERENLAHYLSDSLAQDAQSQQNPATFPVSPAMAALTPEQRAQLKNRWSTQLARAYLNLGLLQLQKNSADGSPSRQRLARGGRLFEQAVELAPDLPQAQYSLGTTYFNLQQFAKATTPLTRALAAEPTNATLQRMTALAWLHVENYKEAARLLAEDPQRETTPSLQYAFAMALVRGGRASEAQSIFDQLLTNNSRWPELHVLLGQAHAQQGDYDAAFESLERALRLKADVAEAQAALGSLYLRLGKLAQAEKALRAELVHRPNDLRSRYHLATVLDLQAQPGAARAELEQVLETKPDYADARYLLGKILLAEGEAQKAAAHLEAAAVFAPEDPNIFYQLGQAYQRLGNQELATQHFATYSDLKKRERGGSS